MPFLRLQPFDDAEATFTGALPPAETARGVYLVTISGLAKNYSSGFQLTWRPDQTYGFAVLVEGWTGPLAAGASPYRIEGRQAGAFAPEILIIGLNKTVAIKVSRDA